MKNNIKQRHKIIIFNVIWPILNLCPRAMLNKIHYQQYGLQLHSIKPQTNSQTHTNNAHIHYKNNHKQNLSEKKKRSQTSHTQSKQISTQITFRRNLLYVPLKESFLLSMRKDPQLKVTQSFPTILTIPLYKAQILFIDGQRISNYFCNREHFFILYQGELFSSTIRKNFSSLTKET